MLGKSITKNSGVLGIFALITATLLAGTFLLTKDRIAQSQRQAAQKALFEIIPRQRHDNDMLEDLYHIPSSLAKSIGHSTDIDIHLARQRDNVVAVLMPVVAPDGYSGDIHLLVGINIDGNIAGVRVLTHRETPGLGDKIDLNKSDWVLNFNNKSLSAPEAQNWLVKKDGGEFDQFTGATITPRAVVKSVKASLEFFNRHRERIISDTPMNTDPEVAHQSNKNRSSGNE